MFRHIFNIIIAVLIFLPLELSADQYPPNLMTIHELIDHEKKNPTNKANVKERFDIIREIALNSFDKEKILPFRTMHSIRSLLKRHEYSRAANLLHDYILSLDEPHEEKHNFITSGYKNIISSEKTFYAEYPSRKINEIIPGSFEASHFGVFAAFQPGLFPYFLNKMKLDRQGYLKWAGKHMQNLGAHWTRSNVSLIWDSIEPELGGPKNWDSLFTESMLKPMYSKYQVNWLAVFHEGGVSRKHNHHLKNDTRKKLNKMVWLRNPLEYPNEFSKFVQETVERFDGDGISDFNSKVKVKYWQAGNEVPFWESRFKKSIQDYIEFVRLIRKATRKADAESRIVLMAPTNGLNTSFFLEYVIKRLAKERAFDVIDIHHWDRADSWAMPAVPKYRRLLDSLGLNNVQIWSTEHGTWNGTPDKLGIFQSEREQAQSLIKRYVFNLNNGLDKLFWNNLVEWYYFAGERGSIYNFMGLICDGYGKNQDSTRVGKEVLAYWSYKTLSRLIDCYYAVSLGMLNKLSNKDKEIYTFGYKNFNNSKFYISWCETGKAQLILPVNDHVEKVSVTNLILGTKGVTDETYDLEVKKNSVEISLGKDPLLIEEK